MQTLAIFASGFSVKNAVTGMLPACPIPSKPGAGMPFFGAAFLLDHAGSARRRERSLHRVVA